MSRYGSQIEIGKVLLIMHTEAQYVFVFHVVLWKKFIAYYGGSITLCISSGDNNRICIFILELLISCIDYGERGHIQHCMMVMSGKLSAGKELMMEQVQNA